MLRDLGLDSLMIVELHIAMEQHLGVAVPPAELLKIGTVGDLIGKAAARLGVEEVEAAREGPAAAADSVEPNAISSVSLQGRATPVLRDKAQIVLSQAV